MVLLFKAADLSFSQLDNEVAQVKTAIIRAPRELSEYRKQFDAFADEVLTPTLTSHCALPGIARSF